MAIMGEETCSTLEFMNKIHPQITVLSAGARNWYGHPAEEVVQRAADAGAGHAPHGRVGHDLGDQ
jgi:beta-lactamase superfamily II metal-dependent hydrolase